MPTPLLDNRQLGPDVARPNLLTNGGFDVWQRGINFNLGATYTADAWRVYGEAGGPTAVTIQKAASIVPDTGYQNGIVFTTTPPAGPCLFGVQQKVEFPPYIKGKPLTFSVRVWSTTVPAAGGIGTCIRVYWNLGGANTVYTSAYHPGDSQWRTLSVVTAPLDISTANLYVDITTLTTSGPQYTWYAANAMLALGTQPVNYVPVHPADDLARCERYYEVTQHTARYWSDPLYVPQVYDTHVKWRVKKPVVPTTTSSPGSRQNISSVAFNDQTINGMRLSIYPAANSTDTWVFNDVVAAEANP